MTTKNNQLHKAWHILKSEGLLPQSLPDGHNGPLLAYKSIDDELPVAIVTFNEEEKRFGVLAAWPLQGRLLWFLNAVVNRKLETVKREPISAATLAGVDEFVKSAVRQTDPYQEGLRDGNPGSRTSAAKAEAARANGAKGGRPKKT